jgi:hypothetical protein
MEAAGRVGRPAMWASSQAVLRNQVRRWLADDGVRVSARQATVLASESRFGQTWAPDSLPAVPLALPDGRVAHLAGSIDRVDRGADGALYVVDHKTGSMRNYGGITDDDPMAGGSRLQLAVYAAAALAMDPAPAGGSAPTVRAEYSFLREGKVLGASFPAESWAAVGEVVALIVDAIATGLFFARPARSQHLLPWIECEYCDPDHLGTAERYEEMERKRADPRLAPFFGIADAPGDGEAGDGEPGDDG